MKLYEVLGRAPLKDDPQKATPELPSTSFIGVEIELENAMPLARKPWTLWSAKGDGSLRKSGVEFVFSTPLQGTDIVQAVQEFRTNLNGCRPLDSQYCSSHVHLNFLSAEVQDLVNFISVYLLFEEALIDYAGPNRKHNLFSLSCKDAEQMLDVYRRLYHAGTWMNVTNIIQQFGGQRGLKYSALNIATLLEYGTVEVRCMRGIKDADVLMQWIRLLMRIRSYALQMDTPQDILITLSENGHQNFITEVFKEDAEVIAPLVSEEEVLDAIDRVQYMMIPS